MESIMKYKKKELLDMDPLDLASMLEQEVEFKNVNDLDSQDNLSLANEILFKATAYISYFKEMETLARIQKRQGKRNKCSLVESDRLLGVEEVFETFKRISELEYDKVVKMMTVKRLQIDEIKTLGRII